MFAYLTLCLLLARTVCGVSHVTLAKSSLDTRHISVNASSVVGTFRNLQGSNNGDTSSGTDPLDDIHDKESAIASIWNDYGVKHVLIYVFPEIFLGFGKAGSAGDPTLDKNYNWTSADEYMKFVSSHGAKPSQGTNDTVSSPEILGDIGFMITDRYMNHQDDIGFKLQLSLFDFYAESDLLNIPFEAVAYERLFKYYAGFAKGVARANTTTGVGAWGGNRLLPPKTNYTVYDSFVSRFYSDCASQNVPIKAATLHFTNAQFSFDPHDIVGIVDGFRANILVPAGLPDLPIWATEYNLNPGGTRPTTPASIQAYDSPNFFASYTVGLTMYAQSSTISEMFSWTGFGFGGYGAGNAYFPGWFNRTLNSQNQTVGAIPLPVAAAFRLQKELVIGTPQKLQLGRSSVDGFAVLAGRTETGDVVKVLLNNYQVDYDVLREITAILAPTMNTSTTAYPLIQENGLLNGKQACFDPTKAAIPLPICQTFLKAKVRDNNSNAYKLTVRDLPWTAADKYTVEIQRVGGAGADVLQTYQTTNGVGSTAVVEVPFPANAQDLVTITRMS